ncbi:hypothetical protein RND71_014367 [Anisodus tanguticus]|uniref:Exosome complex component CSL4 n=1 Tax=Anisodus tanguticus TaxID=243964 RepID=A0AAE1VEZ7_9SOLA|nr:hypothetical protein RND71_014367 [Anisodus tanguticus]
MEGELVTPGQVLGKASQLKAGKGAYVSTENDTVYASLTGFRSLVPPPSDSVDQRSTVEVTGHKAHGAVPQPGSIVFARVTKVMARTASADIVCVDSKSVREKFTGIIRQQDVRATEIDKVDMHLSFRPGDIVRALVVDGLSDIRGLRLHFSPSLIKRIVTSPWPFALSVGIIGLSLGDARAYYLSTAKNELGVVTAESAAGGTMVPISWTEMQCPLTGQVEPRKVAKVGA